MNGVHPSQDPNCIYYADWETDGAQAEDQSVQQNGVLQVVSGALAVANGSITGRQGLRVTGGDEFELPRLEGKVDNATHAFFIDFEDVDTSGGDNTVDVDWQAEEDVFGFVNAGVFLMPAPEGSSVITPLLQTVMGIVGSHQLGSKFEGPLGRYATHSDGTVESNICQCDRFYGDYSWLNIANRNTAGTKPFIIHRLALFNYEGVQYPNPVSITSGQFPFNTAARVASQWKAGNIISPSTIRA